MRIVVFGANGCLGSEFRFALTGREEPTRFYGRELDITDLYAVTKEVRDLVGGVFINCAAYTDVNGAEQNEYDAFRVNAIGASNVAIAAQNCGALLVHFSTDAVFDGTGGPNDEMSRLSPRGVYGRSKALGEQLVRDARGQHVIIRTANLYGKSGKGFRSQIVPKLRAEENINVEAYRRVTPTWARYVVKVTGDLVASHYRSRGNGLYHVACTGETTWWKFAERAALAIGSSSKIDGYSDLALAERHGESYVTGSAPHGLLKSIILPALSCPSMSWEDALNDYLESEST